MKTAIYSLYMRHELAKAKYFIAQVIPELNEKCVLHILINDPDCLALRANAVAASPYIIIHCEGRNLGVAGGRNLLIRRAIDAGAEFLISCDIDIIYDTSYFDRMRKAYTNLAKCDPNLGFLQSVLLDGREVRRLYPILHRALSWDELADKLELGGDWRSHLWQTVKEKRGIEKALWTVYHAGVSNVWKGHFGSPPTPEITSPWEIFDWIDIYKTSHSTLRSELPTLQKFIESGEPIRVASCAGGVVAFHASLIELIGNYDEIFNPFGYEDSEIGFRSMMAGRHNYLVTDAFAIHDIFMGDSNRSLLSHSRIGLLRGVEAMHPALSTKEFEFILGQSLFYCLRDLIKPFGDQVVKGQMTIDEAERQLSSYILSYAFDFLRGSLHGLANRQAHMGEFPLQDLLRGLIDGDAEISNFALPLGVDARFIAGCASSRKRLDEQGSEIFSFFASNCRIEETRDTVKLQSRYFDIACVLYHSSDHQYRINIDVQSDDRMFNVELLVELAADGDIRQGSVRMLQNNLYRKRYEYGLFSVEEIYPHPTLYQSTAWLPVVQRFIESIAAAAKFPVVRSTLDALSHYLMLHPATPAATAPDILRAPLHRARKKRILVFTDSRGQHKPVGDDYPIFGERLFSDERFEVDLFLCPMKWTTTLDFLESFGCQKLESYDHIILYTGIVEWSPRRWSSAINDLYDNPAISNAGNLGLNTRDYSKKICNNKKRIFDEVFGANEMTNHFCEPLDTLFEGEKTANMYSLEMARGSLLPRLNAIPNLIFITANHFVDGWRGDYRRERPANISLIHAYSELFSKSLINARVIDLLQWSPEEVKEYTCDNLHLTKRGSDFIYDRIMEAIGMNSSQSTATNAVVVKIVSAKALPTTNVSNDYTGMRRLERITAAKKPTILAAAKRQDCLSTLIIGVRLDPSNKLRINNLRFLLEWIEYYYGDLFDILLIEQDKESRIDLAVLGAKSYVRHEFIYNPHEYNRGWGYNVAVRHFCGSAEVVVLMDTDVLTGANFLSEIISCYTKYYAISPYRNIYYTDAKEATQIQQTKNLDSLTNASKIKNPVTVSGGILIVRRNVFLALKGFEQYVGYGCEDRSLDVTFYNHIEHERIRIADETYAHLYHLSEIDGRVRFDEILDHLVTNYGCKYDPTLGPYDFIHSRCSHVPKSATQLLMNDRALSFGDCDLYRYLDKPSVNGIIRRHTTLVSSDDAIFPPEFESLETYEQKELYKNAPEPDSAELAQLYNAFKGKRCFIIGNGPSLNKHDLSLLKNEYSFGVNSFYYKTRETGFMPFFYVVEDSSVMKENIEEIRRFDAPYKFFPTNYSSLHPKQPNTFFFRMNRGFYEKSSPNYVVPRFSTDATKQLFCGQSVTYINLQLAYFMGFTEVYLIGMDFSYVIPESHKRTGDVLLSDTDDSNHFHQDYFGKGKTWKDPKLDRVALNYKMAKLVYEATGRRIYNATVGGSLEIFERVDYAGLFKNTIHAESTVTQKSFSAANALYRQKRFGEALSIYVALAACASDGPKLLYEKSAINTYRLATQARQSCAASDVAYVNKLTSGR